MLDRTCRKAHGAARRTGADEASPSRSVVCSLAQNAALVERQSQRRGTLSARSSWTCGAFKAPLDHYLCQDRTQLLREALMIATQSAARHGFELVREQSLAEINSTARYYRHAKTGAELLSLVNADENKVFGVTFATPPSDSTAVAHILYPSFLCGSPTYPF